MPLQAIPPTQAHADYEGQENFRDNPSFAGSPYPVGQKVKGEHWNQGESQSCADDRPHSKFENPNEMLHRWACFAHQLQFAPDGISLTFP